MTVQARVLLIDDDAAALWMARAFLEDAGFEARGVATPGELETMVADWAPDIVVADVDMPGLSGPDLCRMLKDRYQTAHIPVVLYSALPSEELAGLATRCDAEAWLEKTAGLEALVTHLQELCRRTLW